MFSSLLYRITLILCVVLLTSCKDSAPVNSVETDAFSAAGLERDVHYHVIDQPLDLGMEVPVTIAEFFWYGCSHCYHLEEPLNNWLARLPSNVAFVKIPAMWSDLMEAHARAHYITENMQLKELQQSLFPLIMSQREQSDPRHHRTLLRQQFANYHVEADIFNQHWDSAEMDARIQQAKDWQKMAGVSGTPSIVINGRYLLNNSELKTAEGLLHAASKMAVALLKLSHEQDQPAI